MGDLPTTQAQRDGALVHATVWEEVFHDCQRLLGQSPFLNDPVERATMRALGHFAMAVGTEYRKIVNGVGLEP